MQADGSARSWTSTTVTEQLGIEYPVIQAPFGLPSQGQAATVSNLGGLGSLSAVTLSGSAIADVVAEIHSLTAKPFAVNLWVSTSDKTAYQIKSEELQQALKAFSKYYSAPCNLQADASRCTRYDGRTRHVTAHSRTSPAIG